MAQKSLEDYREAIARCSPNIANSIIVSGGAGYLKPAHMPSVPFSFRWVPYLSIIDAVSPKPAHMPSVPFRWVPYLSIIDAVPRVLGPQL